MKLPHEIEHDSDCAMHNAPAYPTLPCDCTVEWLREDGKREGAYEATIAVRAEVLRELLEWEAHYMQQARGGDQSGRSDSRADAAREIHDHLRSSWETRELLANSKPANVRAERPATAHEKT